MYVTQESGFVARKALFSHLVGLLWMLMILQKQTPLGVWPAFRPARATRPATFTTRAPAREHSAMLWTPESGSLTLSLAVVLYGDTMRSTTSPLTTLAMERKFSLEKLSQSGRETDRTLQARCWYHGRHNLRSSQEDHLGRCEGVRGWNRIRIDCTYTPSVKSQWRCKPTKTWRSVTRMPIWRSTCTSY